MIKAGVALPTDTELFAEVIVLTGESLIDKIKDIPQVAAAMVKNPQAYDAIVIAGQVAYADAYKYVYYVSIGESRLTMQVTGNGN